MTKEEMDAKRMELYRKGWSDREIGDAVGIGPEGVLKWRKKHGLKANWAHGFPNEILKARREEDHKNRMSLYLSGATDREIGMALGIRESTVQKWRSRNRLLKNKKAVCGNG